MRPKQSLTLTDVSADIRNRLQTAMTALESLKAGKKVPDELIKAALKDLDKVVKRIS